MTNIYALEYYNEDGEIVVAMFAKDGFIASYISEMTMGSFTEPKLEEAYIVVKTEDYKSPIDNATGHWWQPLATMTFEDDIYAYEACGDITQEQWQALYVRAETTLKADK